MSLTAHITRIEGRGDITRLRRNFAGLDRAAFRAPFLQAAVKHPDIGVAERQEHPPRPRPGNPASKVINNDCILRGNSQRADIARELRSIRIHMRKRRRTIRYGIDIEEHRAGNVRGVKIIDSQR